MRRISHRELRNSSGEVLRAVAAGESIEITNNGVVAAVMSPPGRSGADILDELVARGEAVPATASFRDLRIIPVSAPVTTVEILEDLRGDR